MSVPCVLTESMIRGLEPGDVVVSVNLEGDWRGQRPGARACDYRRGRG